jgi:hypothetical protein
MPQTEQEQQQSPSAQAPMLAAPTAARSISESISKRFWRMLVTASLVVNHPPNT